MNGDIILRYFKTPLSVTHGKNRQTVNKETAF